MSSTNTTIKVNYNGDLRRVPIDAQAFTFAELKATAQRLYSLSDQELSSLIFKYKDDEGDLVTLASEKDLQDALFLFEALKTTLRFELAVDAARATKIAMDKLQAFVKNTIPELFGPGSNPNIFGAFGSGFEENECAGPCADLCAEVCSKTCGPNGCTPANDKACAEACAKVCAKVCGPAGCAPTSGASCCPPASGASGSCCAPTSGASCCTGSTSCPPRGCADKCAKFCAEFCADFCSKNCGPDGCTPEQAKACAEACAKICAEQCGPDGCGPESGASCCPSASGSTSCPPRGCAEKCAKFCAEFCADFCSKNCGPNGCTPEQAKACAEACAKICAEQCGPAGCGPASDASCCTPNTSCCTPPSCCNPDSASCPPRGCADKCAKFCAEFCADFCSKNCGPDGCTPEQAKACAEACAKICAEQCGLAGCGPDSGASCCPPKKCSSNACTPASCGPRSPGCADTCADFCVNFCSKSCGPDGCAPDQAKACAVACAKICAERCDPADCGPDASCCAPSVSGCSSDGCGPCAPRAGCGYPSAEHIEGLRIRKSYFGLHHRALALMEKNTPESLQRAIALLELQNEMSNKLPGDYQATPLYNLACCHSVLGETDEALHYLSMAVAAGWCDAEHTAADEDLKNLHELDAFKAIIEELTVAGQNESPSLSVPAPTEHSLQDFDAKLTTLAEMGWSDRRANIQALLSAKGDLVQAVHELLK